jgi:hypothetical protein
VPASLTIARWEPDKYFNAQQWRLTLSDGSDARFVQAARQKARTGGINSFGDTQYIEMVAIDVPESALCLPARYRPKRRTEGRQPRVLRGGTMAARLWPDGKRNLELESTKVRKRYDIRVSRSADDAWLSQLFSPPLIDVIASGSESGRFYELIEGKLAVFAVNWLAPVPPPKLGGLIDTTGCFAECLREACVEVRP